MPLTLADDGRLVRFVMLMILVLQLTAVLLLLPGVILVLC